jgi:hypothetical protein
LTPFQAQLATRQLVRDMVEEFGAERAAYYCSLGYDLQRAVSAHIDYLAAQNESLRRRVAQLDQAERVPLSSGGADISLVDSRRQGLANKIRGQNL